MVFDFVTDASTRLAGAQNGQYDVVEEIPLDNYDDLANASNVTLSITKGGTLNLFLNTTEGIMANQDMRQAVLAALNCDDILLACYGNEDPTKKIRDGSTRQIHSGEQMQEKNITTRRMRIKQKSFLRKQDIITKNLYL